jgi:hypothetical protein
MKERNFAALDRAAKIAHQLRTRFIVSISEQQCRDHVNDIIAYLTKLMWTSPSSVAGKWNIEYTMKYTGDEESNGDAKAAKLHEYYAYIHPHKTLLWNACAAFADSEWRKFHNPDCKHIEAAPLRDFYEFLEKLGYTMSREEREMMNGTHEYFIKDEDEE